MKRFEMPKFEMIGLSKDLAFAGASDKGANVEFAIPKTTFNLDGASPKFSRSSLLKAAVDELNVFDNSGGVTVTKTVTE